MESQQGLQHDHQTERPKQKLMDCNILKASSRNGVGKEKTEVPQLSLYV